MTYTGYCNLLEKEIDIDNARVQANREELVNFYGTSKKSVNAFMLGGTFVILFCSMPAWADDVPAVETSKKALARRMSNAIGCGAITLACSKAAGPQIVEAAAKEATKSGNPQLVAAFLCGAGVAWCAKYAIFDK